jgi:hypothetical protein
MTARRPPTAEPTAWRAAVHQAAIAIALAVLVHPEWPTDTRAGDDGGLTMSYADDGRKRLDRRVFEAEVVARHAGFVAERLLLDSAWTAGGYDMLRIRQLYAGSRRRADIDLDLPIADVLLALIPRHPRDAAAHPVPPYLARAEGLVREHRPAIERFARQLLTERALYGSGLWDALSEVLNGDGERPRG